MDVTVEHFNSCLSKLKKLILEADFIAIDTELTGLHSQSAAETLPSLFDSIEERYKKLRSSVQKFTISQIGISAFQKENGIPNRFISYCYNFYLFPMCFAQMDTEFSVQASSSAFLSNYGFDFNKLYKEGIPYLNDVQEASLQNRLSTGVFAMYSLLTTDQLKSFINEVTDWHVIAEEGSSIILSGLSGLQVYGLQIILRRAIPTVWTELKSTSEVTVCKVSVQKRKMLEKADCSLTEKVLYFARGFTNLFRILVEANKPLVGHNLFLDLLYLHEKFYRPLPESYSEFKNNIHCLFPCVIDTKVIARVAWKEYSFPRAGTIMQISDILSRKLAEGMVNPPEVCHAEECQRYGMCRLVPWDEFGWPGNGDTYVNVDQGHPHEAAYDAFLSGSAFLKMTHLLLLKKDFENLPVDMPFFHHLEVVQEHLNVINVVRARMSRMCLQGSDRQARRPPLLLLRAYRILSMSEIYQEFKNHWSFDVRQLTRYKFLLAVRTFKGVRTILKAYWKHPELCVTTYRYWQHASNIVCIFQVCSVITVWSIFAFILGGCRVQK